MATEHKKEKRKIRKQQKREKRLKEEQEFLQEQQKYVDIINILKTELYDTKPNMAKLLDLYVKSIRLYIGSNIDIYPEFKYEISKIFIRFKDDSELIRIKQDKNFVYIIERDFKEIDIKEKEKELIEQFFSLLFYFQFIY